MQMDKKQIPIDPDLFAWPSENPHLLGSRCLECENINFPAQRSCPKCGGISSEKMELATKGTLWTWTSQNFRPKIPYKGDDTPETFKPYYLGYVELPGQVRVQSRLSVEDESRLQIGMYLELDIVPFRINEEGDQVMIYVFKPCG